MFRNQVVSWIASWKGMKVFNKKFAWYVTNGEFSEILVDDSTRLLLVNSRELI